MSRRIVLLLVVLVLVISTVGTTHVYAQGTSCAGATQYPIGKPVRTLIKLAIQQHPVVIQYGTDTSGEILDVTVGGDIVRVLGQTCDGDILFLYVNYQGTIGWMQAYSKGGEGRDPGPTVEMVENPPCGTLVVGELGRIIAGPTKLDLQQSPASDPNSTIVLTMVNTGESVMVLEKFCAGDGGVWIRVNYQGITGWLPEIEYGQTNIVPVNANPPQSSCPIKSITVDKTLSYKVVDGKAFWSDSPCDDAVVEITNLRGYWVNLKTGASVGNPSLEAVGGNNNFYAALGVLGPNATVRYKVKFTRPGESVSFLLDLTDESGNHAQIMNFTQAFVDILGITTKLPAGTVLELITEHSQTIVNAFDGLPHLTRAAKAIFHKDLTALKKELVAAYKDGELETLRKTLDDLGFEIRAEMLSRFLESEGKVLELAQIVWRNYGNVLSALFRAPAGAIAFDAAN